MLGVIFAILDIVNDVRDIVVADRRGTVRYIASTIGISHEIEGDILSEELAKRK